MTGRHYQERQNEYFIPGDGISREVIQADICRYLGNDALGRSGYFIRAYRNLTSEMIADLRADSARWEAEVSRRADQGFSRAPYSSSSIHELRQQGGPSPQAYNAPPVQYMQETYTQNPYGIQNPPYPGSSGPYQAATYQTAQPGYGTAQLPYVTQSPQHYPVTAQTTVTAPDQHSSSYIHTSGQSPYGYEARNTAPRYSGPTYDSNESDYSLVTSTQTYPVVTSGAPDRMSVEARYTPETAYQQEHRSQTTRPQQPREREHRRRG